MQHFIVSSPIGKTQIGDRSRSSWISDLKAYLVVRPTFKTARATQENLGSKIKTSKEERSEAFQINILSLWMQLSRVKHYSGLMKHYTIQKLERTQMSLNRGMDTEIMVYLYNGILLSYK